MSPNKDDIIKNMIIGLYIKISIFQIGNMHYKLMIFIYCFNGYVSVQNEYIFKINNYLDLSTILNVLHSFLFLSFFFFRLNLSQCIAMELNFLWGIHATHPQILGKTGTFTSQHNYAISVFGRALISWGRLKCCLCGQHTRFWNNDLFWIDIQLK